MDHTVSEICHKGNNPNPNPYYQYKGAVNRDLTNHHEQLIDLDLLSKGSQAKLFPVKQYISLISTQNRGL